MKKEIPNKIKAKKLTGRKFVPIFPFQNSYFSALFPHTYYPFENSIINSITFQKYFF